MEKRSGKYSITKTVGFCGAHMLPWHDGACQNLHGHLWRVMVTVSRRDGGLDENGIVYDLGKLGEILKELAEAFDHSYLNDFFDNPTAETIANHFLEDVTISLGLDILNSEVVVKRVEVEESPGSKVTLEC